jgi:hypothetical protein
MSVSTITTANPCLNCGACCAAFRVSFYWAEADDAPGGHVPADLTEQISPFHRAMRGTLTEPPRCVALQGEIGRQVGCGIYAQRSSSCMEVQPGDAQCNKARGRHGLVPL